MDVFLTIRDELVPAAMRFADFGSEYSLVSYMGALVFFAVATIVWRRRIPGLRALARAAFPKHILRHASTRADVRLFVVNFLLLSSSYGFIIVGSAFWADRIFVFLSTCFGAPSTGHAAPAWIVFSVTTVAEVLMIDLGYWIGHYLMHRIPTLWEFHKVHHSAEVMTPLTEWRQHPVEMVLMPNIIAMANGTTYGALTYLFGNAQPLTLWQTNILLVVFFVTTSHLRHSHVWLPFTGSLGRLLHSPAHHQIHHSNDPRHFNKNLGFALSVWDWLFGTLWMPRADERVTIGVGPESAEFHDLTGAILTPFASAARVALDGGQPGHGQRQTLARSIEE